MLSFLPPRLLVPPNCSGRGRYGSRSIPALLSTAWVHFPPKRGSHMTRGCYGGFPRVLQKRKRTFSSYFLSRRGRFGGNSRPIKSRVLVAGGPGISVVATTLYFAPIRSRWPCLAAILPIGVCCIEPGGGWACSVLSIHLTASIGVTWERRFVLTFEYFVEACLQNLQLRALGSHPPRANSLHPGTWTQVPSSIRLITCPGQSKTGLFT